MNINGIVILLPQTDSVGTCGCGGAAGSFGGLASK